MNFKTIEPSQIKDNTFTLIGSDWMLLAAGTKEHHNCMTASWGGFGVLWFKNVVYVFVRPQRHTNQFLEQYKTFSLNFFDDSYRSVLQFCGTESGKDIDKTTACNLQLFETGKNTIAFEQARLIITCKKLYAAPFDKESILDTDILRHYTKNDFHIVYIGEILECLQKQ